MDFNYINTIFLPEAASMLALIWIAENIALSDNKSSLLKKLILAAVFATLGILVIPLVAHSLTVMRVFFMTFNLLLLKGFLKIKWTNVVLTYSLATVIVLPPTFLASFTASHFPSIAMYLFTMAYLLAIGISAVVPVNDIYDFFANRVKRGYALALIAIVFAVLLYYTFVIMGDGGHLMTSTLLASIVAGLIFVFYKVADQLEFFRKIQDVPEGKLEELMELTAALTEEAEEGLKKDYHK